MHATETEALDWVKRIFAELPVAGLLSARPIRRDPQHGRITVAFLAHREFRNRVGSVRGDVDGDARSPDVLCGPVCAPAGAAAALWPAGEGR